MAAGANARRARATGRASLLELAAEPAGLRAAPPRAAEAPLRERLRWEKELLGRHLSSHPRGEAAAGVGDFVTVLGRAQERVARGQRMVVGGIVTALRTVITKAKQGRANPACHALLDLLERGLCSKRQACSGIPLYALVERETSGG